MLERCLPCTTEAWNAVLCLLHDSVQVKATSALQLYVASVDHLARGFWSTKMGLDAARKPPEQRVVAYGEALVCVRLFHVCCCACVSVDRPCLSAAGPCGRCPDPSSDKIAPAVSSALAIDDAGMQVTAAPVLRASTAAPVLVRGAQTVHSRTCVVTASSVCSVAGATLQRARTALSVAAPR